MVRQTKQLQTWVRAVVGLVLALLVGACSQSQEPVEPADSPSVTAPDSILLTNARVIDGSGSPAVSGAVRIDGDLIQAVGDLSPLDGEVVIDADGLVLAPGFIDTHSHHDWGLNTNLDAMPLITQGVTTAFFGQDGFSRVPLKDFLTFFDEQPAAINVASFVGHNTLRDIVMGNDTRREATPEEIEAMRKLLLREFSAGAFGISTGLEYEPGIYSKTDEVMTLAQAIADEGGRYISHMRSEDRFIWDAVEEIIAIGKETGMPVQISHMKLAAKGLWGDSARLLKRLNEARAEGVKITADVYPYEYWQSTMWVLLPDRNADNLEEIAFVFEELTPADGIIFTEFAANPDYVNKSVAEIALERGTSEVQTFSDLLKESDAWSKANGGADAEAIMGRSMNEIDISAFLAWPHTNICSDGGFTGHPRGHGTFPRVLARYVREQELMTLEEAIVAMTSRAADHLGITDRGRIAPGMKADLVLFDPATIQDNAGIRDGQVLSTGVAKVWVNGTLVLDGDAPTGSRPGTVLRPQT